MFFCPHSSFFFLCSYFLHYDNFSSSHNTFLLRVFLQSSIFSIGYYYDVFFYFGVNLINLRLRKHTMPYELSLALCSTSYDVCWICFPVSSQLVLLNVLKLPFHKPVFPSIDNMLCSFLFSNVSRIPNTIF